MHVAETLRVLARPSTLIILLANLAPLAGVRFLGWDAFQILMLYWMETAVIAFWTIASIAVQGPAESGATAARPGLAPRIITAAIYTLHAGAFMAAHFFFLWVIFAGEWAKRTTGLGEFLVEVIFRAGLWIPVVAMFIGYGIAYRNDMAVREPDDGSARAASGVATAAQQQAGRRPAFSIGRLYARIVVMQVAIILGAWAAVELGSMAPLLLLIVGKTVVDVFVHVARERACAPPVPATAGV
jgi:hypothetical protein